MIDERITSGASRVSGGSRRRLPLVALLSMAGLMACGSAPFELTLSALESQRSRWEANALLDYRYEYRERCFCGSSAMRQATIEVRGGQVALVSGTGEPAGTEPHTAYPTIDDLFDRIEAAIRDEAAALSVSYDPVLGYPTEIIIDYDYGAEYDEVTIEASDLTIL